MPGRRERDRQLRKGDILKAAEHVFANKGYYKTTVQDIAEEAQYAVGTIYIYFKDKESLYLSLIEEKVQGLICGVKEKVEKVRDIKEKINALIRQQLSYFEENQDFFRIYFSEKEGVRWTIKDKISKSTVNKFMRYIDYIAGLIKKAQGEGLIRRDAEARVIAYILASMLKAIIFPWLKKDSSKKENLRDMGGFIFDVFLNGVGVKA